MKFNDRYDLDYHIRWENDYFGSWVGICMVLYIALSPAMALYGMTAVEEPNYKTLLTIHLCIVWFTSSIPLGRVRQQKYKAVQPSHVVGLEKPMIKSVLLGYCLWAVAYICTVLM
jgi:hypothetical protein